MEEIKSNPGQQADPDELAPICSYRGFRREVLKRTFDKLDGLDQEGIPSFDQFGASMKKAYDEIAGEAKEACA
jgi:hypothetical protein